MMHRNRKWFGFGKRMVTVLALALILNLAAWKLNGLALQRGIADEVLRFHVLANSDEEEDQSVKLEVRDAVLEWIAEELAGQTDSALASLEDADRRGEHSVIQDKTSMEQFLFDNIESIEAQANAVLEKQGRTYQADARIEWCFFPDRTYGDCTFPAGWYKALRICLGEAKGHNWWCMLYPQLCFSDCMRAVTADETTKSELESVLTAEEYDYILHSPSQWIFTFRWF